MGKFLVFSAADERGLVVADRRRRRSRPRSASTTTSASIRAMYMRPARGAAARPVGGSPPRELLLQTVAVHLPRDHRRLVRLRAAASGPVPEGRGRAAVLGDPADGRAARAGLGGSRVHPQDDQVDREVGHDDHEPDHEDDAEDHRQVVAGAAVQRGQRRQPEARAGGRPTRCRARSRARGRCPCRRASGRGSSRCGARGGARCAPRGSLGRRGADERLVHHLDHPHAHEPRVDGDEEERERDPRAGSRCEAHAVGPPQPTCARPPPPACRRTGSSRAPARCPSGGRGTAVTAARRRADACRSRSARRRGSCDRSPTRPRGGDRAERESRAAAQTARRRGRASRSPSWRVPPPGRPPAAREPSSGTALVPLKAIPRSPCSARHT